MYLESSVAHAMRAVLHRDTSELVVEDLEAQLATQMLEDEFTEALTQDTILPPPASHGKRNTVR